MSIREKIRQISSWKEKELKVARNLPVNRDENVEAKARYFTSEFIRIRCIILNCIDQSSDLKKILVNLLTTSFIKTNGNLLWLSLFIR